MSARSSGERDLFLHGWFAVSGWGWACAVMAPRETVRIRAAIDEADTAWNSLQDDINAPSKFGRQNDRSPPVKVYFQIAESINQLKRFSKAFVSPGSGLVSGGCTERLFCEELTDVGECFELERVA